MNILDGGTVLVPADQLTIETLDDGAVIWDARAEQLHALDNSALAVWQRLHSARPLHEVFADVAASFCTDPLVVRRDAMPFLADLVSKGLLVAR